MYLVDIVDNTIDNLSFERFEYNSTIARNELRLSTPTEDHSLANIEDGDHGDDVTKLAGTCTLDIGV